MATVKAQLAALVARLDAMGTPAASAPVVAPIAAPAPPWPAVQAAPAKAVKVHPVHTDEKTWAFKERVVSTFGWPSITFTSTTTTGVPYNKVFPLDLVRQIRAGKFDAYLK